MKPELRNWTHVMECPKKKAKAFGIANGNKMTVLEGSTVARQEAPSMKKLQSTAWEIRQTLLRGVIVESENGQLSFCRDFPFVCFSDAAMVVEGGSRSGPGKWKKRVSLGTA